MKLAKLLATTTLALAVSQQMLAADKSVDTLATALMNDASIPGMVVAKIEHGELVHTGTYGYADIANKRPVSKDTLFNIASVSKPIMGVVLMQLVDQHKIGLDDDINSHLPFKVDNPHFDDEVITLRHLASHTSGLEDYYNYDSFHPNGDSPTSLQAHLESLLTPTGDLYQYGKYYSNNRPGTHRQYSNLGAGVAGQLVEGITGKTLAEYSRQTLFKQTGMTNTSWLLHDINADQIAVSYELDADTKTLTALPHFGNPQYPDGGIRTSIAQLSSFLVQLLANQDVSGNPILSNNKYNEMFTLQAPNVSDNQRFFWRDRQGLTGHMGSDRGIASSMYFDVATRTGFIIVINRGLDKASGQAMAQLAQALMTTQFSSHEASH